MGVTGNDCGKVNFMSNKWISTWFYVQSSDEGGSYAQVSGDSSTEKFRDVYRRCIAVFFQSARLANPDAHLVLYLNAPLDPSASLVASRLAIILRDLAVQIRIIDYKHRPPKTFAESWRNQFFVLDVLEDLTELVGSKDACVVLDSDIVWSGHSTEKMWSTLRSEGISTYKLGYPRSKAVNGLSINSLGELGRRSDIPQNVELDYSGGEFVGGCGLQLRELSREAHNTWTALMEHHQVDVLVQFEEAHLLSLTYSALDIAPGGMNEFIRRLWTQPFKYRNVGSSDTSLALWHVPAEKKYGIRRIYRKIAVLETFQYTDLAQREWSLFCQRELGIPRNSPMKISRDVLTAVRSRMMARSTR